MISSGLSTNIINNNIVKSDQRLLKSNQFLESLDRTVMAEYESHKQELINKIVSQLEVILQTSRALNMSQQNIFNEDIQLEAEKILLIASKHTDPSRYSHIYLI